MKIVTETPYKCDQCGKIGPWIKGQWKAWLCCFKDMASFWDHEFHLCSEECFQKMAKTPKKDLKKKSIEINRQ